MTAAWEPVRQARTHELVLERIEQQVFSGQLHAGDRLPPERQLASVLGVSRSALREALRVLEAFGVLVAHTGRGPDAGASITANPTGAVGRILRLHLALGSYRTSDILEARIMLERSNVAESARRAGIADFEPAKQLLDTMEDDELTVIEYNELDTRFHTELARCSGNELTRTLTAAVRESIRPILLNAMEVADDWRTIEASLHAEHREILRLIRLGEPNKAACAVEDHIRRFHGTLTDND
ncbi:MAG: FadR/GntR family transcriptional regulator [Sciscionella sp.]